MLVAHRHFRIHRTAHDEPHDQLGILNLCGDISDISGFVAALAGTDAAVALSVSVPVITSHSAALRLAALPGVALPADVVTAVTAADDGDQALHAGVHAAVDWARRALAVPGVVGVHLSAIRDDADPTGLAAVEAIVRTAELLRERPPAAAVSAA